MPVASARAASSRTRSASPTSSARSARSPHRTGGVGRSCWRWPMARDLSLIDRLERLYPAVVADCLDRLGARSQVLEPHIRPLYAEAKAAGYAVTVHCVEVDGVPADRAAWYRGELAAV